MAKSTRPTIKLSFPDASEETIDLTERLLEYYSGTRTVKTKSEPNEEAEETDGLSGIGVDAQIVEHSVELTLNMNEATARYIMEKILQPVTH